MKRLKSLLALALALVLCLALFTGCNKTEDEEPEEEKNIAVNGGSLTYPEGMDTSVKFSSQEENGVLYLSYNRTQTRTSGYFVPEGTSITITTTGVTESETRKEYRITLWQETTTGREYVTDGTLYVTADNTIYSGSFSGLTPGARYKIGVAYDGGSAYMSGGVSISGLAGAEAPEDGVV